MKKQYQITYYKGMFERASLKVYGTIEQAKRFARHYSYQKQFGDVKVFVKEIA